MTKTTKKKTAKKKVKKEKAPKPMTYWVIQRQNDSLCYSLLAKRKKNIVDKVKELIKEDLENFQEDFAELENDKWKVTVEKRQLHYLDRFDLFSLAIGEGGGVHSGVLLKEIVYDVNKLGAKNE